MSKKETIIFDFDGTIANSLPVIYEVGSDILKDYSDENISPKEVEKLKESGIKDALRRFDIPIYKFPFLLLKLHVELYKRVDEVSYFPGIKKLINSLKKDYKFGIFTNNRKKTVNKFLTNNKLNYFEFVEDNPFLRKKEKKLKKMSGNVIAYVGDQVGDIEAAKNSDILAVGVSWGVDSKGKLKRSGADFVAKKPEDLTSFFKDLNN